jgi:hypothetical protein
MTPLFKNATIILMIITYDGVESVKISHGDFTVSLNPIILILMVQILQLDKEKNLL